MLQPLHQTIQVTYRYSVYFTNKLFARTNPLLKETLMHNAGVASRVLCVVDNGILQHHAPLLGDIETYCHDQHINLASAPLVIAGGEQAKNDGTNVTLIQEAIHRYGLCRHSYVLAIGGGAVLDAVGYATAITHRGLRLLRVPTTVLAQNDSGVGVKNGINAFGKKNFLGTFAPPVAVLNDAAFLTTLSDRDWCSGISEAIKVALLKDATFFDFIEQWAPLLVKRDLPAMLQVIYRCARLHLEHIMTGGDPFEFGSSRPLDFGHWAAHKLESLSGYSLRHGEAVAIGIAIDATYAYLKGFLPQQSWQRILALFAVLGLPSSPCDAITWLSEYLREPAHPRCLLSGLQEFREHLGGELTLCLWTAIGHGIEVHTIDEQAMLDSISLLANFHNLQRGNEVLHV